SPTRVAQASDSGRARARSFLSLTPEIIAVSTAMLLMNLGENLWRRFFPKYLQSLGAPIATIGLFGTAEDFLDGVYQYPGGWIADRFGRRSRARSCNGDERLHTRCAHCRAHREEAVRHRDLLLLCIHAARSRLGDKLWVACSRLHHRRPARGRRAGARPPPPP